GSLWIWRVNKSVFGLICVAGGLVPNGGMTPVISPAVGSLGASAFVNGTCRPKIFNSRVAVPLGHASERLLTCPAAVNNRTPQQRLVFRVHPVAVQQIGERVAQRIDTRGK